MINLIFFLPTFNYGGAGNSIFRLCKNLNKKKYNISIISIGPCAYKKELKKICTNIFELKKENLLVTVFEEDSEAFLLWKKISGLEDTKILKINSSDNFWSMGETGPCGPCSEIFYDHGQHIKGGMPGSSKQEGDRFIEIWNLVFMQYEMHKSGKRTNLPKPSIDTGMGLERMAAVLQGVNDNYEIDLFKRLIEDSINIAGFDVKGDDLNSHRVIVDHLRASSFLIADGILPTNEGRGYVLRRIMRRAMRHIHKLGIQDTHFWKLVDCLEKNMGEADRYRGWRRCLLSRQRRRQGGSRRLRRPEVPHRCL